MRTPGFTAEAGLYRASSTGSCKWMAVAPDTGRVVAANGIPVYGNHCGPGHGDRNAPAIDAVDQVCKDHDRCYDDRGYFNCGCDRELIAGMTAAVASEGLSAEGRTAGLGTIAYFSSAACTCMKRVCYHYPQCDWHGCHWVERCDWVPYGGGVGGNGPC